MYQTYDDEGFWTMVTDTVDYYHHIKDLGGDPAIISADNPEEASIGFTVFDADGPRDSTRNFNMYLGAFKKQSDELGEAASLMKTAPGRKDFAKILEKIGDEDDGDLNVDALREAINTVCQNMGPDIEAAAEILREVDEDSVNEIKDDG